MTTKIRALSTHSNKPKKKNKKKSIFTEILHCSWSKLGARYHTLQRLPPTIFSHTGDRLSPDNSDLLQPITASFHLSSHPPPPHTLHSQPLPPHTLLSQPLPPHTLLSRPSLQSPSTQNNLRRQSLIGSRTFPRRNKQTMAHASRSRLQEESLLPLYNTVREFKHGEPPSKEPLTELYVLGIPLHKLSRPVQFITCVCGVLFFYLLYGYTQEWIFSVEGFKPFGWYLTLVQFACYSLFGFTERKLRNEERRRIPIQTYALIAFLTVSTMGLSNTSLGYLNYPTQVIFKSCKLIPVMLGGMAIQGKKYTMIDGVALLCMSVGLIAFTLADSNLQPEFNQTGVFLISMALCADAVIGNVQEKALKQFSASNLEMVLFSYFIGFWYILAAVLLSGSLFSAFFYCLQHPEIYLMAFVFSLTGYLGINFVLVLVRSFGALLAVTVTTFRKAITMVLSFLLFTKPFTMNYVWAGVIVLLGILLNLYNKNRSKVNNWIRVTMKKLTYLFRRQTYSRSSFLI